MRTSLLQLGEASDWRCWLCAGPVDRQAPLGGPWAASVDHVVPRSLGGADTDGNRRLAHRRCNGARGNRVPELAWPATIPMVDAPPLFPLLAGQRTGAPAVVVALVIDEDDAAWARGFVVERASLVFGGCWEAELRRETSWWSVLVRRLDPAPSAGQRRGEAAA